MPIAHRANGTARQVMCHAASSDCKQRSQRTIAESLPSVTLSTLTRSIDAMDPQHSQLTADSCTGRATLPSG